MSDVLFTLFHIFTCSTLHSSDFLTKWIYERQHGFWASFNRRPLAFQWGQTLQGKESVWKYWPVEKRIARCQETESSKNHGRQNEKHFLVAVCVSFNSLTKVIVQIKFTHRAAALRRFQATSRYVQSPYYADRKVETRQIVNGHRVTLLLDAGPLHKERCRGISVWSTAWSFFYEDHSWCCQISVMGERITCIAAVNIFYQVLRKSKSCRGKAHRNQTKILRK